MQFQAICSKANKKLTLSLTANNIEEARAILHWQGYSIMELKEFTNDTTEVNSKMNFFYFDIKVNWQIKTWKIQSDDVFKSYKKLIDDLWYDVVYIYTNEGMNEEQKKVITAKVRDSYRMYKESVWEDIDEIKETQDQIEYHEISPEILKEVEKYWLIIDSTIEKIQNLVLKYHWTIPGDKKMHLDEIVQILLQSKWSSNIWKIKLNVEGALRSIWDIELELVKTWREDEKKKFLQETNALLKQIGSNDRIVTSDSQDVGKMINDVFSRFKKKEPVDSKESKKVDKNSFIYFKNQRELSIYKEIQWNNDIQIVKAILTFQFKKVKRLFLKRKLLQQNIQIIDNRIHNKNVSYTRIVHGVSYYFDIFFQTVAYIARIWSYAMFLYIIVLLTLQIGSHFDLFDYSFQSNKAILYLSLFSILILMFSFIRSFFSLIIVFPLLYITFVFLSINF